MSDWQQIKTDSSPLSHCSDYFREHISLCLQSIKSFDSPTSAELFWELTLSDEGSLAWREGVGDLGDSVQSRKIHFSLITGAQMMKKFFQMAHSQKLSSRFWILLEFSPVPCLLVSGTLNLICRITFRKWCFFRSSFLSCGMGASSYLPAPLPCGTWGGESPYLSVPLLCGMGESFYLPAPFPCGIGGGGLSVSQFLFSMVWGVPLSASSSSLWHRGILLSSNSFSPGNDTFEKHVGSHWEKCYKAT